MAKNVTSYARQASPASAWYPVLLSDWGQLEPSASTPGGSNMPTTTAGSGGALVTGNLRIKTAWVTANGVTLPSAEVVQVVTTNQEVTVTQAAAGVPLATQGNAVIAWNLYITQGAANAELFFTQVPIATTQFIVTTSVGAAGSPQTYNTSGIQFPLPLIGAAASADIFVVVPSTFSTFKGVSTVRPNASAHPSGVSLGDVDCIAPNWAAAATISAAGDGTAVASFAVVNSYLFMVTVGGTTGAAPGPAWVFTKGQTTTDNTVTWLCLGKAKLLRVQFENTTATAAIPTGNEYDFIEQ